MNVCYWFPPQSMTEVAGFRWGGECVCGKPLLWAVDCCGADSITYTQWQSITQPLKHRLRLNVQWMQRLLISSVVRDYKYRLINNIFPAAGNILSAGTKLRLNFWGLREMAETGLELLITCTHQDTEHGPRRAHISYKWHSSQSQTRQEVDWCRSSIYVWGPKCFVVPTY